MTNSNSRPPEIYVDHYTITSRCLMYHVSDVMCMCHSSCFLHLYTSCLHCTYLSISVCKAITSVKHIYRNNTLTVNRRIGCYVAQRSFFSCDITNCMEREHESSLLCSQQPNMSNFWARLMQSTRPHSIS
jgi:hypothetical protein